MPILVEQMSVWDIGFRWAGYDPRKFYFRIPLEAENNFRTLMDAILNGDIECMNITLEKREFAKDEIKESIYYWLDDINACIWGHRVNRRLMRWAFIERYEFQDWCEHMAINPLPEFWFPPGWNYEYQSKPNEISPGYRYILRDLSPEERKDYRQALEEESQRLTSEVLPSLSLRVNQQIRLACQQIARELWSRDSNRTIASVVSDPLVQEYGGAKSYNDETVREWVRQVAPAHVKNRRGRPKNKD